MEKLGPKEGHVAAASQWMGLLPRQWVSDWFIQFLLSLRCQHSQYLRLNTRISSVDRPGQSPDPRTHSVMLCKLLPLLEPQFPHLNPWGDTSPHNSGLLWSTWANVYKALSRYPVVSAQEVIFAKTWLITVITAIISGSGEAGSHNLQLPCRITESSVVRLGRRSGEGPFFPVPSVLATELTCSQALQSTSCWKRNVTGHREERRTCRKKDCEWLHPGLVDRWHLSWTLWLGWSHAC